MSEKDEYDHCQSIYWNVALWTKDDIKDRPREYLSQYMTTERCDNVYNLSKERQKYEDFFNKGGFMGEDGQSSIMKKLKSSKKLNDEEEICLTDAVNYYSYWNHKQIMGALKLSSRIYYHTIEKYERLVGIVIPFLAGAGGGYVLTKRVPPKLRNKNIDSINKDKNIDSTTKDKN